MGREPISTLLYENTFSIQSDDNIFSERAKVAIFQLEDYNLSIHVEDEEKPFVYYSVNFTKEDFESLKKKYRLYKNLKFCDFPDRMIELFRRVHETNSDLYMFLEGTERGRFSLLIRQKSAVLDVVHLDITVTRATSDELRTRVETMIDSLRDQLSQMERKYNNAMKESEAHIKTIERSMKTYNELEKRMEDMRKDSENQLRQCELRVQSEKLQLNQEHQAHVAEVHKRYSSEISDLSEKRDVAEKKVVQLQEKFNSVSTKLRECEGKVDKAVSENCKLNIQCSTLKKRILEMDKKVKECDFDRERLVLEMSNKSKALQVASQEKEELRGRLNKIFQENIALNTTLHQCQVEQRNSQFQISSLQNQNSEFEKALTKAHEIITGLQKRLETVEIDRKEAWARCEVDRKQISNLEEQNKKICASLKKHKEIEVKLNEDLKMKMEQIKTLTEDKLSLKTTISRLYKELLQNQDRLKDVPKPEQDLDSYMYFKFIKNKNDSKASENLQSKHAPLSSPPHPLLCLDPNSESEEVTIGNVHEQSSDHEEREELLNPKKFSFPTTHSKIPEQKKFSPPQTCSKQLNKENVQLCTKVNPKTKKVTHSDSSLPNLFDRIKKCEPKTSQQRRTETGNKHNQPP